MFVFKNKKIVALSFLLIIGFACPKKGIAEMLKEFEDYGFSVVVKDKVLITIDEPAEDFALIMFESGGKVFLKGYVGNHPDFPDEIDPGLVKTTRFKKNGIEFLCQDSVVNAKYSRHCLLHLKKEWPMYVHYVYFELTADKRREAISIIESTNML
jgi:hypothetical protein